MENGVSRKTMIRLLLLVLGIALLCTMAVQFYNSQYRQVMRQERVRLQTMQRQIEAEVAMRLMALQTLASDEGIWELEPQHVANGLKRPQQLLGFLHMTIYNRTGAILAQTMPPTARVNVDDDRQYIDLVLKNGRPMVTELRRDKVTGANYFSWLAPIFDAQQKVNGVIIADMAAQEMTRWLPEDKLVPGEHLFVRDDQGQFIYHPGNAAPQSEQEAQWLTQDQGLALRLGNDGTLIIRRVEEERLYLYAHLENAPWQFVLASTMQRIYLQVFWQSIYQVVFFLLVIVLILLLYRYLQQGQIYEENMRRMRLERLLSVNQMAAGLAHEIRNPLTTIKGFVQLRLQRSKLQGEQDEHFQIILGEIERLDKLVGEFQQLTKPMENPRFVRLDLGRLVTDVLLLMGPQGVAKKVRIIVKPMGLPSGAPVYMDVADALTARLRCEIIGDESQLKQVVINLVKNAIESVDEGGCVEVGVGMQEGMAALVVRDDGAGMTSDVVARLGTPFFTTKNDGNGLGLSISYNIVENHGGRVVVKSQPGRGAVFIVLLPLADR